MENINQGSTAGVLGNGYAVGLTDGNYNVGMRTTSNGELALGLSSDINKAIGSYQNDGYKLTDYLIGVVQDETKSGIIANLSQVLSNWIIKY